MKNDTFLDTRDPTVIVLNKQKRPILNIAKTVYGAYTLTSSFTGGSSAVIDFDPSGTYQTIQINGSASVPLGSGMADWTNFAGCFDEYHVDKISCKFTWLDSGVVGTVGITGANAIVQVEQQNFEMCVRYNWDSTINANNINLQGLSNAVCKTFSREHPDFVYDVFPRVDDLVYAPGVTTVIGQGREPVKMKWEDVERPSALNGLFIYCPQGLPTQQTVVIDLTYYVKFKYNE